MKKIFFFLFLCVFSKSGISQSSIEDQPSFVRDSLDGYIEKGIEDWQVPGLSIVIVKNGKVVWMKGYGVKNIETKKPVDENTLFMIASNTKLFTGSSLAMLESDGKISLDDQITKYFPAYRLYDSTSTKLVSIRDMLSHHIGTKTFEGDFTFWNTSLSREEIMRRMRYLIPPFHFRQEFGYCNSCFLVAGQVIPIVTGETWEHFVQSHFLSPLDMDHTLVLSTGVAEQSNVATPYSTAYTNQIAKVPYDNWNNLAPAASIVSNVNDLSHWLFMQLDSGSYKGKRIISWEALEKTRIANTWIKSIMSDKYPTHFTGYGLGLSMQDYAGRQVYWHTGGAGGMVSNVCFVPEEKLGIAILTNNDNQGFFEDLRHQVLDAYLGVAYVNRSEQDLPKFRQETGSAFTQRSGWNARVEMKNKPRLSLVAYTGDYNNTLYGKIHISQEKNHLFIRFDTKPDLNATLEYMDEGEWLLKYNNIVYGQFAVNFALSDGKVKSLTTRQNPYVEFDPYVFSKVE
jgi:CubicO group peptidase (beta-lactamase class C family)